MKGRTNGPIFNIKLINTFYENCFDSNYSIKSAGAEPKTQLRLPNTAEDMLRSALAYKKISFS